MSRTVLSLFLHHSMTIFCETQCKINATQENQPYHSNKEHFENPKYFVRSILLIVPFFQNCTFITFFYNSALEILAGYETDFLWFTFLHKLVIISWIVFLFKLDTWFVIPFTGSCFKSIEYFINILIVECWQDNKTN